MPFSIEFFQGMRAFIVKEEKNCSRCLDNIRIIFEQILFRLILYRQILFI